MFSKILKISQQNLGSQKSLLLQAIFLTAAAILVNGLVTGLSELWFSLSGQLVFALGYGFTQGAYFSSQLVVLRCLNREGSGSLGLVLGARGLASLVGPMGAGVARDLSGSYSPGFVAGALLALLAAGLTIPLEQKRLAEAKKVGAVPDETFNGTKCS